MSKHRWYYFTFSDRTDSIHIFGDAEELRSVLTSEGYKVKGYAPVIYDSDLKG